MENKNFGELKRVKFKTNDGIKIKKIRQFVHYLDGWWVLTEDGNIYSNATLNNETRE